MSSTIGRLITAATLVLLLPPSPRARAQQLAFRTYARDQGLPSLDVSCLAQDRIGYIYACTEDGLYRYDGLRFAPFGADLGLPKDAVVEDFETTPDGHGWAVLVDGIYALSNGRFVEADAGRSRLELDKDRADALLGDDLLQVIDGRIMRAHQAADGHATLRPMPTNAPGRIVSLHVDSDGIWAGCGTAICRIAAGRTEVFGPEAGVPETAWFAFLRDTGGRLWARSATFLARLDPGGHRFQTLKIPGGSGRYDGIVHKMFLAEDAQHDILTQGASGLLLLRDGSWTGYDHAQGVPPGLITAMMFDREHALWLGNRGHGIERALGFGAWESWTRASGLSSDSVWEMAQDYAGALWVAGDSGLDRIAAGRAYGVAGASGETYSVVVTRGGAIVTGATGIGVVRRDQATGADRLLGAFNRVEELLLDRLGRLWIATDSGLFMIEAPDATGARSVPVPVLAGERIHNVREAPDGDIWVLGRDALRHRDRNGVWHDIMPTAVHGGGAMHALAIAHDGAIWVGGSSAGAMRLTVAHERITSLQRIAPPDIASRNVLTITEDRRDRIWVGSDGGIDMLDGDHWRHFDEDDGLLSNDVSEGAITEDRDGSMWFGTSIGLAHLLDARRLPAPPTLLPVITGAWLGGRALPLDRSSRVGWQTKPLVVRFSALDFQHERSLRFRYRLVGVDADWSETEAREVHYASLPRGALRFDVVAIDPIDGRISAPVSFAFRVEAPWWRNWPFDALAIAALVVLLIASWRLRVRMLLGRQLQLEGLVAARTSEIDQARRALLELSRRDSLTGLLNRAAILAELEAAMQPEARRAEPLALALIDLDHFKRINDDHGHLAGDAVLQQLGGRLGGAIEGAERVGRYGGEEMLAVLPGIEPGDTRRLEALRAVIAGAPCLLDSIRFEVTSSAGITWWRPGDDLNTIIHRADLALYRAKRKGRDRIEVEAPEHEAPA